MDTYSSGEELVIKTRKPYTITKQRERWTEEEHNRFLEALKLYGRAWQRIEEHIGTKTAVQIRSHAQKFFTKLEKEALTKGVPIGHALDIEIPPPRPKRKPSTPYPRKTGGAPNLQFELGKDGGKIASPFPRDQTTLDLDKEPFPEKPSDDGKRGNDTKEILDEDSCSKVFTLLKTAPCTSPSSDNNRNSSSAASVVTRKSYKEFVPISKDAINHLDKGIETNSSLEPADEGHQPDIIEQQLSQENGSSCNIGSSYHFHDKYNNQQSKKIEPLPNSDNVPAASQHNFPRHVPVHILDAMNTQNVSSHSEPPTMHHQMCGGAAYGHHPNQFISLLSSSGPAVEHHHSDASIHQSFPSFHPVYTPIQNQEDYQSFLQMSSTFSSLIVSALLQNPAAHAAATFAATSWPSSCANMEHQAADPRQINSAPSMAAIAAATVAAATAWWAAHGLLPLCGPSFHPGFTFSPPASASVTPMESNQQPRVAEDYERKDSIAGSPAALGGEQLEPECSEAFRKDSASKSPTLSPSEDSEESENANLNAAAKPAETCEAAAELLHDSNKSKSKKQVDRSSCGSNTPSGSDAEADALGKHNTKSNEEKNHVKVVEEPKEQHDLNYPACDSAANRRCRSSTSTLNDSWKEVSQEGRLAFQALFSREVLPQSFSPQQDLRNKGKKNDSKESAEERDKDGGLCLGLNGKLWDICSKNQALLEDNNASLNGENNGKEEELLLSAGTGYAKQLKSRRTGFKPYKRCSLEAKDSRVAANGHDEEKSPKRLRLETEASV